MPLQNFKSHWRANTQEKQKDTLSTYAQRDLLKTKHDGPTCQTTVKYLSQALEGLNSKSLRTPSDTPLHHWWDCKAVRPLWKSIWQFLITLNIHLTQRAYL